MARLKAVRSLKLLLLSACVCAVTLDGPAKGKWRWETVVNSSVMHKVLSRVLISTSFNYTNGLAGYPWRRLKHSMKAAFE